MAYLINQIGYLLIKLIDVYRVLLLVYFLMSWLPGAYQSSVGRFLYRICEPYVSFFRQFIPPVGFISFAGLAALLALNLVQSGLVAVINFIIRLTF